MSEQVLDSFVERIDAVDVTRSLSSVSGINEAVGSCWLDDPSVIVIPKFNFLVEYVQRPRNVQFSSITFGIS